MTSRYNFLCLILLLTFFVKPMELKQPKPPTWITSVAKAGGTELKKHWLTGLMTLGGVAGVVYRTKNGQLGDNYWLDKALTAAACVVSIGGLSYLGKKIVASILPSEAYLQVQRITSGKNPETAPGLSQTEKNLFNFAHGKKVTLPPVLMFADGNRACSCRSYNQTLILLQQADCTRRTRNYRTNLWFSTFVSLFEDEDETRRKFRPLKEIAQELQSKLEAALKTEGRKLFFVPDFCELYADTCRREDATDEELTNAAKSLKDFLSIVVNPAHKLLSKQGNEHVRLILNGGNFEDSLFFQSLAQCDEKNMKIEGDYDPNWLENNFSELMADAQEKRTRAKKQRELLDEFEQELQNQKSNKRSQLYDCLGETTGRYWKRSFQPPKKESEKWKMIKKLLLEEQDAEWLAEWIFFEVRLANITHYFNSNEAEKLVKVLQRKNDVFITNKVGRKIPIKDIISLIENLYIPEAYKPNWIIGV